MKLNLVGLLAVGLLAAPTGAESAPPQTLIDTGQPSSNQFAASSRNRAGRFHLGSPFTINSIESRVMVAGAGNATVAVLSDASGLPGTVLFATTVSLQASSTSGWQGTAGLNWSLPAGTYWVAMGTAVAPSPASGLTWEFCGSPTESNPVCVLPDPMLKEAAWADVGGGVREWQERFADTGWRLTGVSAAPAPGVGFSLLNPANGHRYEIVRGSRIRAESVGLLKGGHLVTIDDEAEQQWLVGNFQMDFSQLMLTGARTSAAFWIGLGDEATEGVYRWTSGELLASTGFGSTFLSPPWAPLEPTDNTGTGGGEDVVGMNFRICDYAPDYIACTADRDLANSPGLWNDFGDGQFLNYGIIEYPAPQFQVDPRASFLLAGGTDSPAAPLVIDLVALGIQPGTLIRVARQGDFAYGDASVFDDTAIDMLAVFSSTPSVLGTDVLNRVAGAIDAGNDVLTPNECAPQTPGAATDITQDFRVLYDATLIVPPGAAYLVVGLYDCYYSDNRDPDGDLGVTVTAFAGVTTGRNVSIGFSPVIGVGTTIDRDSVIGSFVTVGSSVQIKQSTTIGNNVKIGDGTTLDKGAIVQDNVTIGTNVNIDKGSVICAGASIGDNATLKQNSLIKNGETVPAGTTVAGSQNPVSTSMCST